MRYENLITNNETEIRNLLKFSNLKWSEECLNFNTNTKPIKTASDIQARSKIYKTSINTWKNYDKYLSEYFNKLIQNIKFLKTTISKFDLPRPLKSKIKKKINLNQIFPKKNLKRWF